MIKNYCIHTDKLSETKHKYQSQIQQNQPSSFTKKSNQIIDQTETKQISQSQQIQHNQDKKKLGSPRKKLQKHIKQAKDKIQAQSMNNQSEQVLKNKTQEQNNEMGLNLENIGDDCAKQLSNLVLTGIQKSSKSKSIQKQDTNSSNKKNDELISSCSVETLKKISYTKLQQQKFFEKSSPNKPSKWLLILQYKDQQVFIDQNNQSKTDKTNNKSLHIPQSIKNLFDDKKTIPKINLQYSKVSSQQTYDASNQSFSNLYNISLTPRSNQSHQTIVRQRTNSHTNQIPISCYNPIYGSIQSNQKYGYQQYYQQYIDYYEQKLHQSNRKRRVISYQESKAYIIQLDKIQEDGRTTIMIRNIPNKYTHQMLIDLILRNNKKKYDFFYLPIDYTNSCNMGYAFINFLHTKFIKDFYKQFNDKKWEKFNSQKICSLSYARIQGTVSLMNHFQQAGLMNQKQRKGKNVIDVDGQLMSSLSTIIQKQKQQK